MVEYPSEFVSFLRNEQARGYDSTLQDRRATAIKFYEGQPYGDEIEGRSRAVTRDTAEVIDFMQTGILNTIMASGKAVEFETESEPVVGDDGQPVMDQRGKPVMVDYGEEATAAVRYQFFRKQNGYLVLHDALKAGQMEMTGIVKTIAEPQRPAMERRQVLADEIVVDEGDLLARVDGLVVVESTPADADMLLWNVVLEFPQPPVFRDLAVPNEYFRISPDATCCDDAVYIGDRCQKSLSELVAMGYDPALVDTLSGAGASDTTVENARDGGRSQTRQSIGNRTGANRMVWLEEEYPLYDLDGDGIAERLFVHRVGNVVLAVMEVDEQPYSAWSPFPRQHRFTGDSTSDKSMDIQRIRSVLIRQGLDSIYLSTSPRTLIAEEAMTVDTIDDLLTVRPGGLIRYKGGNAPQPMQQQDTSPIAFNAMDQMLRERESRTGMTRQAQGINPDVLNRTASGLAMNLASAQQIELYITRNFAEMLVAPMFAKRYRLMRKYGQPFRMKVEGKYREIDPRKWPADMDMVVNVGIGTGNKDQKLAARDRLFDIQERVVGAGGRIVGEEQVYQNVRGFIADSGLGSASDYVLNPADMDDAPPRVDPEAAKVEADAAVRTAKDQQAHEQAMARLDMQAREHEAANELRAQQVAVELEIAREKAALDDQLKRDRADFEARLAMEKMTLEIELARERMRLEIQLQGERAAGTNGSSNLSANRPGGDLAV